VERFLITIAICYFYKFATLLAGFRCRVSGVRHRKRLSLYETPSIKQRTAEQQNIEPQNGEGWNRCALSFEFIKIYKIP
jgi:hypothetical protein